LLLRAAATESRRSRRGQRRADPALWLL